MSQKLELARNLGKYRDSEPVIHHIGNVHKYARLEDVPEHTMFLITTDGMENASRRYNSEKVKHMIERQKTK